MSVYSAHLNICQKRTVNWDRVKTRNGFTNAPIKKNVPVIVQTFEFNIIKIID